MSPGLCCRLRGSGRRPLPPEAWVATPGVAWSLGSVSPASTGHLMSPLLCKPHACVGMFVHVCIHTVHVCTCACGNGAHRGLCSGTTRWPRPLDGWLVLGGADVLSGAPGAGTCGARACEKAGGAAQTLGCSLPHSASLSVTCRGDPGNLRLGTDPPFSGSTFASNLQKLFEPMADPLLKHVSSPWL